MMDIVFVSPEIVPFSKVGGLGDVAGSLPKALRALGHKVNVISLLYGSIDTHAHALARRLAKVKIPLGDEVVQAEIYECKLPSGVQVTLLAAPGISDRPGVYGEDGHAYPDNHRRFAILARGAVEWLRTQPRMPDVVHAHDWPAALVPAYLKLAAAEDPRVASVRSVFTIHNVAHQGIFPADTLAAVGLPPSFGAVGQMEFYGAISWLKAAILHADRLTTVSPGYSREILTPEGGDRMDGLLRTRTRELTGILNGVDYAVWNPATDPALIARFDAEDTAAKARCKADLQQKVGLPVRPDTPVLGMVARMDAQKGVDLVIAAAAQLVRQEVQLVIQGSGDPTLMEALAEMARAIPEKVVYRPEFDDTLAHKIYGGSDFFLVPSRFEPCGLTQMYAMRYGTVPIVRATGGLRDTVVDCDGELTTGTGFVFESADGDGLYGAIARGLTAYARREPFDKLRRRVMRLDWSWDRSARRYQTVYQSLAPVAASATA